MTPILELREVSHVYGAGTPFECKALDDISLSVRRGEFIGLIGHTGSGKSTLIQHFNGLLRPTSGQVLLSGEDIWDKNTSIREVRFRVGLVFQYPEYQLFEETVAKDIAYGPTNMGLPEEEIQPTCISDVDDERFRAQLWKMKELLETQVKKERFWEIDEEFLLEIGTCIGELMFAKLKVKTEQA